MKKFFILAVCTGILFSIFGVMGSYNGMVTKQENATTSFANLEATYQRRADLLPNLAKVVKGYATHESETFKAVAEARASVGKITIDPSKATPEQLAAYQKAQGDVSNALSRLMVISEKYPELKASQNFRDLQTQIEGTENRINYARQTYNESVQEYNKSIRSFPTTIFAGMFGFEKMNKFEADKKASSAPDIDI